MGAHKASCLGKTSEATCSPNANSTDPYDGHTNTGCSWFEREIHVQTYSSTACTPTLRTADIVGAGTGCPTCTISGDAYVELTPDDRLGLILAQLAPKVMGRQYLAIQQKIYRPLQMVS